MGVFAIILIIINVFFSWKGLKDHSFFERYNFNTEKILIEKDYKRLITSGFLHVNWAHLIFNMLSLYIFSDAVEIRLGMISFIAIYFASLIGGNLFSLFVHRHHSRYTSAGASGAVCGIIFASIAVFPGLDIRFFFIPIDIPAWIFGLLYVIYSIWGIRSKADNVGHEAHLAGALVGLLIAILIQPASLRYNYLPILAISVPSIIFIYIILTRPHILLVDNNFFKTEKRYHSIDHKYNAEKMDRQKQIDLILDKIHRKGMKSLTRKERELLSEYSKTVR